MLFLYAITAMSKVGYVTATTLNVRSGPSTGYGVSFQLFKNDIVEIICLSGDFYQISSIEGQGYVSKSYISTADSLPGTTISDVNFRSGASTSTSIYQLLKFGTKVNIVGASKDWVKVTYGGKTGYLSANYVAPTIEQPVSFKGKVTKEQLSKFKWTDTSDKIITDLNNCIKKFGIDTIQSLRHFMSQCALESAKGRYIEEIADGSAYEGRTDLGNIYPGDGKKFKGAGYIQMTGRANYQAFANFIGDQKVMDGVKYAAPKYPWQSAGFWWMNNNMNKVSNYGASVKQVTKRVNGGYNGLDLRRKYYAEACEIF